MTTDIQQFNFANYDKGGAGATAGDGRLTGDEVKKAKADGWCIWEEFREDDEAINKNSGKQSPLRAIFNMYSSKHYKEYSDKKNEIIEQLLAKENLYPSNIDGKKLWNIDIILFDERYKKAEAEAAKLAKKELGLSENAFTGLFKIFLPFLTNSKQSNI